jgi:hypothetical protein
VRAKAIDNEARHRQTAATIEQRASTAWGKALAQAEAAASAAFEAAIAKLATAERHRHAAVLAAEADNQRCHEAVLVAEADDQRRHEAVLVADAADRPRNEAAARAAEQALTLVEECRQHEYAMRAALFAASCLADEQPHHKVASSNLFDAAKERIQATCDLLAAPLDAILADIEREDIMEEARTTLLIVASIHPSAVDDNLLPAVAPPLVGTPFLPSAVNGNIQKVCPCTRPRRRTGRRNIPRAPSSSVEVPHTHPNLLPGGLSTPTSTMLARTPTPCRSVVSSPTPASTTPHTPSLHSFTFEDGTLLSSRGGKAHPFCARGLSLPPWKRTRRKYRPNRTCRRHQPHAPNQSTGWA